MYAEYHHRDHLGNVRVAFADRNGDNLIELVGVGEEITQEADYYPFGLRQQGAGLFAPGREPENRYLYNGIEHVKEVGLDLAAFRSYDAAIGRWVQVDPLAESFPNINSYRFGFNNPISWDDPSGLLESGGDDPERRDIQYNGAGMPTSVRLGYNDSGLSNFSFNQIGTGSHYGSGSPSSTSSSGCPNCPQVDLPMATVTSQAPADYWRVNGSLMSEEQMFMTARHNDGMAARLLREEFGTATAIKFMQFDINGAIFDFSNNYVNPLLTSFGPMPTLAIAKFSGLALAGTGLARIPKTWIGMRVGFGGSRTTLGYTAAIYKYRQFSGLGNQLGSKVGWTPFGRANQAATYYGRWSATGAIGVGGTVSGAAF